MLDKLRDLLSGIKFKRDRSFDGKSKTGVKDMKDIENRTGVLYKLWLLVLPVLIGLVLGRLASILLGYGIDTFASNAGMVDAAVSGKIQQTASEQDKGLEAFLATNPFHVSARPKPEAKKATPPPPPPPPPKTEEEEKPADPPGSLDDVIVRGTFPGVAAYLENKGSQKSYLIGREIEGYRVASVSYREVVFTKGQERVSKHIVFGPVPPKPQKEEPKQEAKKAAAPPPKPAPEPVVAEAPADNNTGSIIAAQPGQQEGQVPVEMVSQLVQNPFDELKRIRIRPNEKDGGLEVQWIQSESILKRLGVQKGDVIKSVNGIPFSNMGDIANSINSLMNSERFDVEVTRGGKSTSLRYVVR